MSISTVTSEALQLKLRQLLPSQQGFGTDLSASDTIIPIIDLTASAEGSDVRADLQKSFAFGSNTSFDVTNTTTTLTTTAGFWLLSYDISGSTTNGSTTEGKIVLNDGASDKTIQRLPVLSSSAVNSLSVHYEIIVFLRSGDSIKVSTDTVKIVCVGSYRQVADSNGTLIQPVGFSPS